MTTNAIPVQNALERLRRIWKAQRQGSAKQMRPDPVSAQMKAYWERDHWACPNCGREIPHAWKVVQDRYRE